MPKKNIRTAYLTIITEKQKKKTDAEKLTGLIVKELGDICSVIIIDQYLKFENSYKIEFALSLDAKASLTEQAVALTDKISSPWTVYYDKEQNTAELIFNKNEHSAFRKEKYKVIRWGHLNF